MACPLCPPNLSGDQMVLESVHSVFIQEPQPILIGSGLIVPRAHRQSVFELTPAEWHDTWVLLEQVKHLIDAQYRPDGYNLGWNNGAVAGQEIFHAHLHVLPRYRDEPYAGRGIRYWLKQPANRRD